MSGIRKQWHSGCVNAAGLLLWRGFIPLLLGLAVTLSAGCAGGNFKHASLYQRLGGKGGLVVIVDGWLARAAADGRTAAYFSPAVIDRIRPLLVDQLCEISSGPCRYAGRDMKSAHAGLGIDAQAHDALLGALDRALDQVRVPVADKKALIKLLDPLRKDVIAGR